MSSTRLANFRRLLAAALGTQYYRPWLEAASLHTPQLIQALDSIEAALKMLPPVDPEVFLRRREEFRSPAAPPPPPQLFYPYRAAPRTAVLAEGFRPGRRLRVFPNGLGRRLTWFRPQAVAGPLEKLGKLAEMLRSGALKIPPLTHAVIVFVRVDQAPLSEEDRERLWRCYQVPVYQQLLGFSGELLAWECEAHQGLHVVPEAALFENHLVHGRPRLLATSLVDLAHPMLRLVSACQGHLTHSLCGCGQAGERLMLLSDLGRRPRPAEAAKPVELPAAAVLS